MFDSRKRLFAIFSPVERIQKSLIPKSIPTVFSGSGLVFSGVGSFVSTHTLTQKSPHESLETATLQIFVV